MEPRVQYVTTADGVRLAHYEMGQGHPFVYMNVPFSHLTAEWQREGAMFNMIASNSRLIRYDHRGLGLSDREPAEYSLDAFVRDLETVVDHLELERFIINAAVIAPPVAIAYAVRHPERVSHLVLVGAAATPPKVMIDQFNGLFDVARGDWRYFSEAVTRLAFSAGWEDEENAAEYAALLRESTTLDEVRRLLDAYQHWDIANLLPQVQVPTLVVSTKSHPWHGVPVSREVAARLPNGQLAVVDDSNQARFILETTMAVRSFLGRADIEPPRLAERAPEASGTAIILFTDIADSTALTERLGDGAFRGAARTLDERMRAAISAAGGTPVDGKVLGDGVMATFASAAQAIDGARRCLELSMASELRLHLGIHAGDVIREPGNVYGGAVNIAARICGVSAPGEILVSATVRDLARTSAGVMFDDRGEYALKGIDDPVRVFAVMLSS
jgi:class 3 adenylate cyclase